MAITRPSRPTFLVSGTVIDIQQRRRYDETAKRFTDEVTAHELTLRQADGSMLAVRYPVDPTVRVPVVLETIHVYTHLNESREYGASLRFVRDVTENDLDLIHSAISAPATASK